MDESRRQRCFARTLQGRKGLLASVVRTFEARRHCLTGTCPDTAGTSEANPMTTQAVMCFGINNITDCISNPENPTQQAVMSFGINRMEECISQAEFSIAESLAVLKMKSSRPLLAGVLTRFVLKLNRDGGCVALSRVAASSEGTVTRRSGSSSGLQTRDGGR